jgi:hypothetical protein
MDGISIDIYVETSQGHASKHAFRRWTNVPRVGDFVELKNPDMGEGYHLAKVFRLHWGEIGGRDQCVAMFCRWHKPNA